MVINVFVDQPNAVWLHDVVTATPRVVQWISLGILGVLGLGTLLRMGARGMLEELLPMSHHHEPQDSES